MKALFSELMKFFLVVDFLSVLLLSPDIKCLGNSMSTFYLTLHQGRYSTKLAYVSNLTLVLWYYTYDKRTQNKTFTLFPTGSFSSSQLLPLHCSQLLNQISINTIWTKIIWLRLEVVVAAYQTLWNRVVLNLCL